MDLRLLQRAHLILSQGSSQSIAEKVKEMPDLPQVSRVNGDKARSWKQGVGQAKLTLSGP